MKETRKAERERGQREKERHERLYMETEEIWGQVYVIRGTQWARNRSEYK